MSLRAPATGSLALVYVVPEWNRPTETFVRREVAAALDAGHHLTVVSLKPPVDGDEIESRIDLVHVSVLQTICLAAIGCLRRPVASARCLWSVVRLGRRGTWVPQVYAVLVGIALHRRIRDCDLVHAHFAWVSATTAATMSRLVHRPWTVFVHAYGIYDDRFIDAHLRWRLSDADAVFVESERIAADVLDRFGVATIVMRMGVPPDLIVDEVPQPTGQLIASVGALRQKKGHDVLIRSMAALPATTSLAIAGEGDERSDLRGLVERLGLHDRVTLLGHLTPDEVRDLLDRSRLFCLASRLSDEGDRDGVPNVLIEAMARGVPVVATHVSGIPDLLGEGCGLLVDPDDPDALAQAIKGLLDDSDGSQQLASKARARILTQYTTTENWALMEQIMRSLVGASRAGDRSQH